MATLNRYAIYARFSSDKQSDASIEDQVHRARAFISAQGINPDLAQVFSDYAVSGASMDRPGMRALEDAIKRAAIDVLITESVDRISRDVEDAARFRKLIATHEVELACLDGTRLTAGGKSDALMFGIRSIFAEQYRLDLADKTRRGLEGRARAGAPTGAVAYGFSIVANGRGQKAIAVDSARAAVVRRIFADYAAGRSFAAIAESLNAEGAPQPRAHVTRTGQGWMATGIRAMLLNERYVGRWVYGEREWVKASGSNTRRPRQRKSGALVTTERPELAIVDLGTWEAVQKRFGDRPSRPAQKKRTYLLSGIARCALCGGPFSIIGGGAGRRRFGCYRSYKLGRTVCANRQSVLASLLEEKVLDNVRAELAECMDEVREVVVEEIRAFAASRPDRHAEVAKQLSEVERQIGNLVNVIAESGSRGLMAKLGDLEARKVSLADQLAVTARPIAPTLPSPADVEREVASLSRIGSADPDIARERLQALFKDSRIECTPDADGAYWASWDLLPAVFLGPNVKTPAEDFSRAGGSLALVAGARFVDQLTAGLTRPGRVRVV